MCALGMQTLASCSLLRINTRTCACASKAAKWQLSDMGSVINKGYCCPQPCFANEGFQLLAGAHWHGVCKQLYDWLIKGEATLVPKLG